MRVSRYKVEWIAVAVVGLACAAGCKEVGARRDIQEGNKAYYASKYEEAIKLYDDALQAEPSLAIGWYNLGLSHLALFSPGLKTPENEAHAVGAITAFKKYMALAPEDITARDYLLSTEIDSGHWEEAVKYFQDKLAASPDDKDSVAQIAKIYTGAGQYDLAIKFHAKLAEMESKPDSKADSWYTIGVLDWRRLYQHPEVSGADRLRIADEGIGWLQKADSVRKAHSGTLSYLNLLYRERGLAHEASYARAVDTATAQRYFNMAKELVKKQ